MDDSTLAAIAAAGNSIASAVAQTVASQEDKWAQKRSFEYNMQMAQYQNEVNRENWHMQNQYNTPSAQMARLKEAGLNPNLVYGGGSAQTPATSIHAMPGATMQAYQGHWRIADAVGTALDGAFKAMQVKKAAQEVKNLEESQRVTHFDASLRELQIIGQKFANAKTKAEADLWRELYEQRIINLKAEGQLTDSKRFLTDAQKLYLQGPQTSLTNQQRMTSQAQQGYYRQQTASSIAEMGLIEYRKNLLNAQAANALAQAGVAYKTADRIVEEINNLKWDSHLKQSTLTGKDLENKITQIFYKHGVDLRESEPLKAIWLNLWHNMYVGGKSGQDWF